LVKYLDFSRYMIRARCLWYREKIENRSRPDLTILWEKCVFLRDRLLRCKLTAARVTQYQKCSTAGAEHPAAVLLFNTWMGALAAY